MSVKVASAFLVLTSWESLTFACLKPISSEDGDVLHDLDTMQSRRGSMFQHLSAVPDCDQAVWLPLGMLLPAPSTLGALGSDCLLGPFNTTAMLDMCRSSLQIFGQWKRLHIGCLLRSSQQTNLPPRQLPQGSFGAIAIGCTPQAFQRLLGLVV